MFSPDEFSDTIAAIATAPGGAIAIIRVSGPEAAMLAGQVWQGRCVLSEAAARQLHLGSVRAPDGREIDSQCLAVRMPAPHSYTGEDVVELHVHGGSLCVQLALRELLRAGCRLAEPGEFTRRAFVNGKLDLTQAEAVAELLSAGSERALGVANQQLQGQLGQKVRQAYDRVKFALSEVEARLDFPEEDLDWGGLEVLPGELESVCAALLALAGSRHEGEILRGGVSLAIAGEPNVGKSSLLNAILGHDRAIVSDVPGTTRDSIEAPAHIRGIPLRLIDTAGLRESGDQVERMGIARSQATIRQADIILWVMEAGRLVATDPLAESDLGAGTVIFVANKADAVPAVPAGVADGTLAHPVYVSALQGTGLEALYDLIEKRVWRGEVREEHHFAVSARHADLLESAAAELKLGVVQARSRQWELLAVHLREAMSALGRIIGLSCSPDLLGEIFARFCMGK